MSIEMRGRPIGQLSYGQEALEGELMAYQASCLLVSHDRSFIRSVGNRFWRIEKQNLTKVETPESFDCLFGRAMLCAFSSDQERRAAL